MEVCLICNERDPVARKYTQKIYKNLKIKGFQVYKDETTDFLECEKIDLHDFKEFVIIIGDSRSFLKNIGRLKSETKIVLISTEQKSFFSDVNIHKISSVTNWLKNEVFFLEKRTRIGTCGNEIPPALNEVAMFPKRSVTLMRYTLKIDSSVFYRASADGLVLSTPTGSTGYSLSLGGPIIKTDAEVFLINPVAPIGKKVYPLVVSDRSMIELDEIYSETPIELVVDGYFRKEVSDKVIIKKEGVVYFVRFDTKPVTEKIEEIKEVLDLPPSAKYILKILQYEGPMTQKELIKNSLLPERTVRNALNILLKKGFIVKKISVRDARQDLYKIAKRIKF